MKWSRFAVLVTALFATLATTPAGAQTLSQRDRGTHYFRFVLHRYLLQPIDSFEKALAAPDKSLIIVLGNHDAFDDAFPRDHNGSLTAFLEAGGALLFASDLNTQINPDFRSSESALERELQVQIDGHQLGNAGPPHFMYRGMHRDCPLLQTPVREDVRSRDIDLLKGLTNVATNRPTFLRYYGDAGTIDRRRSIAELRWPLYPLSTRRFGFEPKNLIFAMAGRVGAGRYVVMADHSLFINLMMEQGDNDNIQFAMNTVSWLTDDGKRTQVLFVDDGQIRSEFNLDIDLIDLPLPHPDVIGPLVDQVVMKLESDDFFNQLINRAVSPRRVVRGLLLAVTILAVAAVLYRITAGRFRREARIARLPARLETLATPMAELRGAAAAAGRELAFRTLSTILPEEPAASRPPQVHAAGILKRRRWSSEVRRLWRIATGQRAVAADELAGLAGRLHELARAVESGDIIITTAGDRG